MRPVHRRLLDLERATLGEAIPRPNTPKQIAAAEKRLGRPLPPGYRAFLEEVGRCFWPLAIGNVIHFEAGPWPDWFVPFADDGGGNHFGFDVRARRGRELPIDFWDHEEPELDDEPGLPQKFEAWLAARLDEEESRALDERRRKIASLIAPHHASAFTPDRAQVEEIEALLGVVLPADFVWFTTTLGATRWPVRIADALELPDLTAALRARWPRAPARTIAFAREAEGAFAAFDRHGRVRGLGLGRPAPTAFLDYVEDRIAQAPAATPLSEDEEDVETVLAGRLLERLRETGRMETTRGFDPEPVARAIADAWSHPRRILDLLLERADVIEVYASDDEIAAIQSELTSGRTTAKGRRMRRAHR